MGGLMKTINDQKAMLPTIDCADRQGDVLVTNHDGSCAHVHYSLVQPWMTWQALGDGSGDTHPVAHAMHYWVADYAPSLSQADKDHQVMIIRDRIVRYIDYSLVAAGIQWCPTLEWYMDQYAHHNGPTQNTTAYLQPLTFVSVSRSFGPRGEHFLDAVTADGTAWYKDLSTPYTGHWERHQVPS